MDFDAFEQAVDLATETMRITEWVSLAPGVFNVRDVDRDLGYETSEDFIMRTKILQELVDEHLLDNHKDKRGYYRPFKEQLELIDYNGASEKPLDIWLPMGLSQMVEIMPGVIVVAGAPNAGKTSFVLNIIKNNMHKWDIRYFNSEMSSMELKMRLKKFDTMCLSDWKFTPYARADNFSDVIFKDKLNVIDFLEIHDEFYKVGGLLKDIHDRVGDGVAIVCLQKNKGSDTGLGGFRTLEVARLAIAIDQAHVKIIKAKVWKAGQQNPNGCKCGFKLLNGADFIPQGNWIREK